MPSIMISPEVGVSNRLRQRSNVDLPVPDGPIIEITSPRLISVVLIRFFKISNCNHFTVTPFTIRFLRLGSILNSTKSISKVKTYAITK